MADIDEAQPSVTVRTNALNMALPPVIGIFFTVFLDLLSFGLFIPDLQLRGKALGAEGLELGALLGVYSLAQLLTAPILGRISDSFGRRHVLMITTIMSTIAYVVYAHGTALWVVLLARIFLGVAGASVGVGFAYMADVTTPEARGKGMGLLGAAFGLGFILGPVAGGLLLREGQNSPLLLGYVGAGLAFINFLYVWLLLPESNPAGKAPGGSPIGNLKIALATPGLGFMLAIFFVINFAFTNLETTFFLLLADPRTVFHYSDLHAKTMGSYVLGIVGLVSVFVQGFLIRRLMPVYGEVKLLRFAYVLMPCMLVLVPFCPYWIPGLFVIFGLAAASGLGQPSLSSLISRNAPKTMQGGVFGITQSLGAVARLLGPLISIPVFRIAPYLPYVIGAVLYLFPMAGAWTLQQPEASSGPAVEEILAG